METRKEPKLHYGRCPACGGQIIVPSYQAGNVNAPALFSARGYEHMEGEPGGEIEPDAFLCEECGAEHDPACIVLGEEYDALPAGAPEDLDERCLNVVIQDMFNDMGYMRQVAEAYLDDRSPRELLEIIGWEPLVLNDEELTHEEFEAVKEALGNDNPDIDALRDALADAEGESLESVGADLKDALAAFKRAGGQDVELADEIDGLRAAQAVLKLRTKSKKKGD